MKIIIAGYGVEGISNLIYFRQKFPDAEFVVADERPADKLPTIPDGVKLISGKNAFSEQLGDADLVVRTASLPPRNIKTRGKIWSATNEFFDKCPAPIIGVTGTKGKGTTCSLIASILRQAGQMVHLVGNIGVPALDVLPKIKKTDIVVYELSSFQLWDLEKSPHIAVVLMIEPDHLNVHTDFADYLNAKKNIRCHQHLGDVCLYHPTNKYAQEVAATPLGKSNDAKCGHCDTLDFAQRYAIPDDDQVYVQDGYFCVQNRQICSTNHLLLPGAHNLENACAAMSAVTELPITVTDEQYAAGLESFTGLPHRLKFVAEKNGVKYYDDSISTTPGSAIAALKAFTEPKVLILGGSDKGADYTELAQEIARQQMRAVIVNGANASEIAEILRKENVSCQIVQLEMATMPMVVETAANQAQSGDVVILSPAAASFDMFKSYNDRGEQFVAAVENLAD
ncbi:UDP-N-acetylmuramoyl-L-alanine--D-glutamate ligase [Candidatus Nanosynsacchari sp. TM7_ANC_38.39_G1_1]|uniref:UDP-N-acetylmuramoyl-L-alanine--D-glutamate ligase n=1 Tax=Candidatus Nanosynsacchari sp. TM7_ANC_38.39_G1_1 TaxID=1986206 RepID=UPI0013EB7805|nr:UDP-N-acetylmuramoyl-L-alanine--D-glutamate ligase [Candidatus Nanosynsacchari sp. TM7_ANC_38.39_G1_1]